MKPLKRRLEAILDGEWLLYAILLTLGALVGSVATVWQLGGPR
jgi:hypothetical protein